MGKFSPVLEWNDDAESGPFKIAFDTRSPSSKGRAKNAAAGRVRVAMVRAGDPSSSAPQDPSDLEGCPSEASEMYPPVQLEAVQADDRSEQEGHSSVILPDAQQVLDDEAPLSMCVLHKAVGRPRKAEQLVLTPDDAPEP